MNKIAKKFFAVPVENDTRILFEQETTIEGFDVLYQWWTWDMFIGESLIFFNDAVARLTDQEIESLLRSSGMLKRNSPITLSRSDSEYVFCNFNFK